MFKLRINGVRTILSTHWCKWVPQYTTAATIASSSNSMVEYLVNSLGFSKEEAFITSSKVSSFKSTENSNSVIDFLNIIGLSQTQIKNLVSKAPKILSSKVDKTLKPKIKAFQDMGFSRSDLARILTLYPAVCWRSVNDIKLTFDILRSLFGNKNDDDKQFLITAVKKSTWLLHPTARKELPAVISLLKNYGLSVDQIKAFSLRKPRYFSFGIKVLGPVLIRVEKLGIARGSPMFYHGIIALCSMSEANLELKKGIYKSYGFTDEDVSTLARKNPYALMISDSKLRTGLDFFLKDVGYLPSEIASLPHLLTYSFGKRLNPRYTVLKFLEEKGAIALLKKTQKRLKDVSSTQIQEPHKFEIPRTTKVGPGHLYLSGGSINVSVFTCFSINESQFFVRFVKPYKDQYPDLYRDYMKAARSVLEAAK